MSKLGDVPHLPKPSDGTNNYSALIAWPYAYKLMLVYGWIGQQSSSGFINMPRLALGVFASSDRL
jgi:hypothetical protein